MSETTQSIKSIFRDGPLTPVFIAEAIAKHQTKIGVGAHNIFLGQVRADTIDGKTVAAIDFSGYEAMVDKTVHQIREACFDKFDLSCMHIYHSNGRVPVGEVCFMVMISAAHRPEVYEATEYAVNRIKSEVPIFGKEIFEDGNSQWKVNKK